MAYNNTYQWEVPTDIVGTTIIAYGVKNVEVHFPCWSIVIYVI